MQVIFKINRYSHQISQPISLMIITIKNSFQQIQATHRRDMITEEWIVIKLQAKTETTMITKNKGVNFKNMNLTAKIISQIHILRVNRIIIHHKIIIVGHIMKMGLDTKNITITLHLSVIGIRGILQEKKEAVVLAVILLSNRTSIFRVTGHIKGLDQDQEGLGDNNHTIGGMSNSLTGHQGAKIIMRGGLNLRDIILMMVVILIGSSNSQQNNSIREDQGAEVKIESE